MAKTEPSLLARSGLLALFIFGAAVLALSSSATADTQSKRSDEKGSRVFITFDAPVGAAERALVRAHGGDIVYSYSIIDAVAAHIPEAAREGLQRNPHVVSIEADAQVQALDVELDNSWGVERINAGAVHENASAPNKGTGVKIGIIDSGINYLHPDLDDNYAGGYDFYYYDDDPMDVYGHGTHVAGTACAEDNGNGETSPKLGVVGVAPECELYGLRVLNEDGVGYWSDIVAAVEWATGAEVQLDAWGDTPATTTQGTKLDVVNLSLGKDGHPGAAVESAFQTAYDSGLLIVAAAGNSGNRGGNNESTIYPAKFDSVIAVAATDSSDKRATFSSTGEDVELAAPGVNVYSTWNDVQGYYDPQPECTEREIALVDINGDGEPDGECYKYGSGTSMASPHVAGAAALVIAAGLADHNGDGVIDPRDARSVLQDTAIDLGRNGRDGQYGYGLVDAYAAVQATGGEFNSAPSADAGADDTIVVAEGETEAAVTLDGSGSSDVDGTIVSYEWSKDGGWLADGVTPTITLGIGEHTITLTVTDDDGATDSDTVQITVIEDSSGDDGGEDSDKCPPGWQKQGRC